MKRSGREIVRSEHGGQLSGYIFFWGVWIIASSDAISLHNGLRRARRL